VSPDGCIATILATCWLLFQNGRRLAAQSRRRGDELARRQDRDGGRVGRDQLGAHPPDEASLDVVNMRTENRAPMPDISITEITT
jgi:hypothetical protein